MWWYAHNKCALKYASFLFSSPRKRGQALRFILSLTLTLTKLTKKNGASFSVLTAAHNFPSKLQEQQGLSLHQWRSKLYLTRRLLQSPQPQVHENWIGFFFFGWKLYMIVLTIIIIILLLKIIFGGNGDEEEAEEERIWYGLLCCAYHCS